MQAKILVADDETAVRALIARALAHEAYQVLNASDGEEAIGMARTHKPDLILLDINMPKKNGHQVLRALRDDIETQTIPVIMLSGHGAMLDKIQALDMGADDYVAKPFDILELRARIASVLRRYIRDISANPLTKLPGSPAVEEEVVRRMREGAPFSFFHIDIDDFKAFNDVYGYAAGDQALRDTAQIILESLKSQGGFGDFVGHLGGDDFVLITQPDRAEKTAMQIASAFDGRSHLYYKLEDRAKGYVVAVDRQGYARRFPLMTLSIAIAAGDQRAFEHYGQLVQAVTEIKRHLKAREDRSQSVYMTDRRRDCRLAGGAKKVLRARYEISDTIWRPDVETISRREERAYR